MKAQGGGEQRYGSTLSLNSALDGVSGEGDPLVAFPLGKSSGKHCTGGWVGPLGRSDRVRKTSPSCGFDPRIVQPVTNHNNDYGIP